MRKATQDFKDFRPPSPLSTDIDPVKILLEEIYALGTRISSYQTLFGLLNMLELVEITPPILRRAAETFPVAIWMRSF